MNKHYIYRSPAHFIDNALRNWGGAMRWTWSDDTNQIAAHLYWLYKLERMFV